MILMPYGHILSACPDDPPTPPHAYPLIASMRVQDPNPSALLRTLCWLS